MNTTKKQYFINLGLLTLIVALFIGYTVNSRKLNVITCLDFGYQEEAQLAFSVNPRGHQNLDVDGNGVACQWLPAISTAPTKKSAPQTSVTTPSIFDPHTFSSPTPTNKYSALTSRPVLVGFLVIAIAFIGSVVINNKKAIARWLASDL